MNVAILSPVGYGGKLETAFSETMNVACLSPVGMVETAFCVYVNSLLYFVKCKLCLIS